MAYTGGELPRELLPKPACLEEMFQIAEQLAKGIPHVRVDLYVINERPYFGEMTFSQIRDLTRIYYLKQIRNGGI